MLRLGNADCRLITSIKGLQSFDDHLESKSDTDYISIRHMKEVWKSSFRKDGQIKQQRWLEEV